MLQTIKKYIILAIVVLVCIIGIFVLILEFQKTTNRPRQPVSNPTISPFNTHTIPHIRTDLPITSQGNTDATAPETEETISEVKKLYPFLPYETTITTSNGVSVD